MMSVILNKLLIQVSNLRREIHLERFATEPELDKWISGITYLVVELYRKVERIDKSLADLVSAISPYSNYIDAEIYLAREEYIDRIEREMIIKPPEERFRERCEGNWEVDSDEEV